MRHGASPDLGCQRRDLGGVYAQRASLVCRNRGAVEAKIDSYDIRAGTWSKRVQATGQRLDFPTALGLQPAETVLTKKDAAALRPMGKTVISATGEPIALEKPCPGESGRPAGRNDPPSLIGVNVDNQVAAAVTAPMAVKPLEQR